jgi:TM2 domain-containing membrane protein YozV
MVFCRECGKEISETAVACPHCGAGQRITGPVAVKSQTVAALLTAFLGGLGIHRFYLGKPISGVFYLLFCWTGIPSLIAILEVFFITFMSQERWAEKYNKGQLSEPVPVALKILALIFPILFILGIIGAIGIPAYEEYTIKGGTLQT